MGGQNRIVLDYGNMEELVLLSGIEIDTGKIIGVTEITQWSGPKTKTFPYETLAEALAAKPRPNAEGLVVRNIETDEMIKIKQEDYIQLHRLVFGLNERTVWEHLSEYGTVNNLIENLPDEFHEWVHNKADILWENFMDIWDYAHDTYANILNDPCYPIPRKVFAEEAMKYPTIRPYLFMLYDGKRLNKAIWKSLKPKGNNAMKVQDESVA